MKFLIALLLAAPSVWASAPDALEKAIQFPVEKYSLPNGLTVLLHPDNSIPAVSVQTWFRVGSKDEARGRTGLAHFFEHMMFKGTKAFGKDTWGKFLNSKGADMNAFTSNDYTGYYINAPAEQLDLLLEIESDRMRNLLIDPKEVVSEREVVKEERRMRYEDQIDGGIRERMASLMYEKSPYSWLPIGSMADLNAASMDDLHAFYKQFYSPNNAVLVVAGSFDTARVKKAVEKYYGGLPRENITRPVVESDPPQKAMRTATISREAQAPTVAIGYRLPDISHADHYALDLLSIVLGQGNSSRLYKDLVYKKEIALSVSSYSWGQALGGQFVVYAGLKPKVDPQVVVKVIDDEMRKLRHTPISQKELDKARNVLLKDYVDGLKKVSGRARMIANYEIVHGDYTRIFSDLKKYQDVTPQDLTRVAMTYLTPSKRNIVIVLPKKGGGSK
ncbi:MAG: insulinase family protein [Bdellovibrionales bacterium]|nr:insulinase family protein [Bdellovibrionales bacterium]